MTSDNRSSNEFGDWWAATGQNISGTYIDELRFVIAQRAWEARQPEVDAAQQEAERADRLWKDTARWWSERCQRRDAVLEGMTEQKLLAVAEWMDILDVLLDKLEVPSDPTWKPRLETARGSVPRDTIQKDLRKWAKALSEVESEDKRESNQ